MQLGDLLSNAGLVSKGIREAEEATRVARQNQLLIEEQNRLAELKKRLAETEFSSLNPVPTPKFLWPPFVGAAMPIAQVPETPVVGLAVPKMPEQTQSTPSIRPIDKPPTADEIKAISKYLPPVTQKSQTTQPQKPWGLETPSTAVSQIPPRGENVSVAATQNKIANATSVTGSFKPPVFSAPPIASASPLAQRLVEQSTSAPASASIPVVDPEAAKQAAQYDNKKTPYDDLIHKSAVENGIDPTIFRRLIATESSFRPNAVSSRGKDFGLGIAQLAGIHGLTDAQRLDPNTAIPFAARLFSQYLKEANGDYEKAIQKYKGASSEKGKASVAKAIETILAGVVPTAQAQTPPENKTAAPALLETPRTQARNMEMADFYLANPQAIPYELQQLQQVAEQQAALILRQRNEAAQLARLYMQSGTSFGIQQAERLGQVVYQADAALLQLQQQVAEKQMYLQGMQALNELANANDPRRLAGVLSQYLRVPVGIQPRSDGKYNVFVNGRKVYEGITAEQLSTMALMQFSPGARAAQERAAEHANKVAVESQAELRKEVVKALGQIQEAIVKREYDLAVERAKRAGLVLKSNGDQVYAEDRNANKAYQLVPGGSQKIDGIEVKTPPHWVEILHLGN